MRTIARRVFLGWVVFLAAYGITAIASAQTRTIRVVTYNIEDDISNATTPLPGLISPSSGGSVTNGGVLEGIGEEILGSDPAQPIDILALQETTSNPVTVQPIVDGLNAFYSSRSLSAGYAMSPYQGTDTGGSNAGNGPNAMVYNTNTLQLVASVGVGTPGGSSNGEYRQVVRYEFAPAGVTPTTNNEFYVYVSHYKSGTTSGDITDRNGEAQIVRADSATLPSNTRILYTGDFNASTSGEAMYQTLIAGGANQGYDVLNPSGLTTNDWGSSTTSTGILAVLTESATNLRYRDDYQMMTSNVLHSVAGGLAYIPGTYHTFGNNGTTPYNGNMNSGSDTALNNDLNTNVTGITAAQLYQYLTTGSDHLPEVADYTIPVAAPYSPQSIQTVFIILEENQNWASISGNAAAPYINNGLLPKSSYTLQYYNPPGIHPSLPNYFWLEAGTNFGILADGDALTYHEGTTNHLVTLLKNAGVSWTSFQEGISGTTCPLTDSGQYVAKHNPMVHFDDVTNTNNTGSTYCISNVRPFTELAGDLQSNVVTRYNFITPNLCNDMHGNTGCLTGNALITAGDTWLSNTVAEIVSSQAYSNNGVIFVTWDEGEGGDGPIGMIVLSPLAKGGGYSNTNHYTHSSTLLTMQEIFNVGPLLGDAVNAIDLSDLFVFGANLAVNPASGLTSSGQVGGPFSPSSQIYTLSNTGGVAMAWTVSNTASWLTLSATSGTLAAGGSTNIVATINANANSLAGGGYSDTISFATSNGSGNTTRPVSLTVNSVSSQLSVSPGSGFSSAGAPGGPFNPVNQIYTLSNIGGATMTWTANNSANWLTLSATGGTLAPSASTNVTATINANANSLTAANYSDTIGFTNTTSGAGNTTRAVSLNISSFGFYDDFSTFASGNLVGQHSWTQVGTISAAALQVSGGKVFFTGGLTASSQTAYKNFTLTNETVYYGLTLTLTNTVNSGSVSYFTALYTNNNATGFANYRLSAKSGDAANTNFLLGVRVTGQSGNPYTFGTTTLNYGTQYRVIVQASATGTNMIVYVNPTSTTQGAQTQYANNPVGSGSPPATVGSLVISEFGTTTVHSDGGSIGKAVVADSFATVYNDLLGALPPVASFSGSPTSGTEPLVVTFSDTSTGTITNRFWDFGDTSTTNITTNSIVHTYAAGAYTVTLIASGLGGAGTNTQPNYINVLTAFQAWQVQYFGSTNNPNAASGVDADGTGQNNLFKYVAGLDPTNPSSVFQLQVVAVTNQTSQESLLFNPVATGRTYTPQFSTDLVGGVWLLLPGYTGPVTNGNQVTITDTNAVDPQRFYRIDISLP